MEGTFKCSNDLKKLLLTPIGWQLLAFEKDLNGYIEQIVDSIDDDRTVRLALYRSPKLHSEIGARSYGVNHITQSASGDQICVELTQTSERF